MAPNGYDWSGLRTGSVVINHTLTMSDTKNKSVSPVKSSNRNVPSVESIGIGNGKTRTILPKVVYKPESIIKATSQMFDCVVFLIYCPEHDNVLMINNEYTKIAWLPYTIHLQETNTWKQTTQTGIEALIGRKDPEMDSSKAEKMEPKYSVSYLQIMRIQSSTQKFYTRIAMYVKLKPSNFKCCHNENHMVWYSATDLIKNNIKNCWGPEVKLLLEEIKKREEKSQSKDLIEELSLTQCHYYLLKKNSCEQELLVNNKIKAEHLIEIYDEYLNHTYPAVDMCYRAFKCFLVKYGFEPKLKTFSLLFKAFTSSSREYVDFNEFIIGLVCIEPSCSDKEKARIRMVFRYYDLNRNHVLNEDEISKLLEDSQPDMSTKQFKQFVRGKIAELSLNSKLPYEQFKKFVLNGQLDISKLLRSPKPVLPQISKLMRVLAKAKRRSSNSYFTSEVRSTASQEGHKCIRCRKQNYGYGTHMVTANTMGKCVQPKSIVDCKHSI